MGGHEGVPSNCRPMCDERKEKDARKEQRALRRAFPLLDFSPSKSEWVLMTLSGPPEQAHRFDSLYPTFAVGMSGMHGIHPPGTLCFTPAGPPMLPLDQHPERQHCSTSTLTNRPLYTPFQSDISANVIR